MTQLEKVRILGLYYTQEHAIIKGRVMFGSTGVGIDSLYDELVTAMMYVVRKLERGEKI